MIQLSSLKTTFLTVVTVIRGNSKIALVTQLPRRRPVQQAINRQNPSGTDREKVTDKEEHDGECVKITFGPIKLI